jgi:hypothetical protein
VFAGKGRQQARPLRLLKDFELPKDAHVTTMQILKNPSENNTAVATVFHRGNFLDTPEFPQIPQNSLAAVDEVTRVGATLVELDVRDGWIAHKSIIDTIERPPAGPGRGTDLSRPRSISGCQESRATGRRATVGEHPYERRRSLRRATASTTR